MTTFATQADYDAAVASVTGGFYRSYKHSGQAGDYKHIYEVTGLGHRTEEANFNDATNVLYRPMYAASMVYEAGKRFDICSLVKFTSSVEYNSKLVQRFTKITDPELVLRLTWERHELYGRKSDDSH